MNIFIFRQNSNTYEINSLNDRFPFKRHGFTTRQSPSLSQASDVIVEETNTESCWCGLWGDWWCPWPRGSKIPKNTSRTRLVMQRFMGCMADWRRGKVDTYSGYDIVKPLYSKTIQFILQAWHDSEGPWITVMIPFTFWPYNNCDCNSATDVTVWLNLEILFLLVFLQMYYYMNIILLYAS